MTDSMARSNNGAAVRGLLLVLAAVAVGVLLLRSSDTTAAVSASATTAPAPGVTQPLATEPETTDAAEAEGSTTTAQQLTPSTVAPADTTVAEDGSTETTTPDTVPVIDDFMPRPAAEVKVQVANSTSTKGAAGSVTDQFKTLNYITATPTNLRGTALDRTRVHYQPGSLLEAQAVAEVLGLDPKNDVFQMFQDTAAIDQWDEPDVLVALGTDLADS